VRLGDCGDVAVDGDGEPGELEGPDPDGVGLGDVELADGELGVGDPAVAGGVTVNCSMAMGALPPAAWWHPASTW
jgi:hypothetical protein